MRNQFVFFLGGRDLEMVTIRELLEEAGARFEDKGLLWGAKTSAYRYEISRALEAGLTPVLVEIEDDMGLPPDKIIDVSHHGALAGINRPTALHQVFQLLGLPQEHWSRWFELVAANDRGYIPALVEAGATKEEIERIRSADRTAQGITDEEEAKAKAAIDKRKDYAYGLLTVVRLPHNRASVVADLLVPELGGPGYENLLVISPGEVNFFGGGEAIRLLDKELPGGWFGGALPERGFWGSKEPCVGVEELLVKHFEARLYKVAEDISRYRSRAENAKS